MQKYDLNEIAREIHENAKAHGWWEEERPFHEIVILIHSEWSEALEEYRAGRPMVWHNDDGKPEGIAVELIDGVIRIMDWMAHEEKEIDEILLTVKCLKGGITDIIYDCHELTASAAKSPTPEMFMQFAIYDIFCWLESNGLNPMQILLEKHEYNKHRPYKHGGKAI